jgi:leucyl-tRNA synthetase
MQFHNEVKDQPIGQESLLIFLRLLYPFAPHITEELNELLGGKESLQLSPWPEFDASKIIDSTVQVIIQINGKLKDKLDLPLDATEDELKKQALGSVKVQAALGGKRPARVIVVPNRLVNIVLE